MIELYSLLYESKYPSTSTPLVVRDSLFLLSLIDWYYSKESLYRQKKIVEIITRFFTNKTVIRYQNVVKHVLTIVSFLSIGPSPIVMRYSKLLSILKLIRI